MDEVVYSSIGAQPAYQVLQPAASTRPLWLLRPLPLQQVNEDAHSRYHSSALHCGRPPSLQSFCLALVSQHIHTYEATELGSLAPHLVQRVMHRVRADRNVGIGDAPARPDDATLWVYSALADPEGTAEHMPSFTLALPPVPTLQHLAPSRQRPGFAGLHPLVAAPLLFYEPLDHGPSRFAFLTTLQFDGLDDCVTDNSVLALRYATRLTCLWTRGCRQLTDDGIRALSVSLSGGDEPLGDERGLWNLRAWWLTGCSGVTDRSMQSFARWPGLALLDLRNTSCTDAAIQILNRADAARWGGAQPPFQKCTVGLRQLFTDSRPPEAVLADLADTLIQPDIPTDVDPDSNGDTCPRRWLSLHLTSTHIMPPNEQLPQPKLPPQLGTRNFSEAFGSAGGVYKHGMGHVYGPRARSIEDDTIERRRKLQLAFGLKAVDQSIDAAVKCGGSSTDRHYKHQSSEMCETRKNKRRRHTGHATGTNLSTPTSRRKNADGTESLMSQTFLNKAADAAGASRTFVKGRRLPASDSTEVVRGGNSVMLVRMVSPRWRELRPAAVMSQADGTLRVKRSAGTSTGVANMLRASQTPPGTPRTATTHMQTVPNPAHKDVATHPVSKPGLGNAAVNSTIPLGRVANPKSFPTNTGGPFPTQAALPIDKQTHATLPAKARTLGLPAHLPFSSPPARTATAPAPSPFNPFRAKVRSASARGIVPLTAKVQDSAHAQG